MATNAVMSPPSIYTPEELWARAAEELAGAGVIGVTIVWADNNGIPRSRTVPIDYLADCAARGVGISPLYAVIDSHDSFTFTHPGLSNPSGEVRLLPVIDRLVRLKGQPAFAWAPGRQVSAEGTPWPYDQRSVLERQVAKAEDAGLSIRAGYQIEFYLSHDVDGLDPGHRGPASSPHALLAVDEFIAQLLSDLAADGIPVAQLHAEHREAQLELSIAHTDPVSAADRQLLARQTIHAAARTHGLRASFAPLVDAAGTGNSSRLHTSVWRRNENLMQGDGPHGLSPEGAGYVAGLLRDLPALAAVTAPSVGSLARLRPGRNAESYTYWGVGNREAPLRVVSATSMLGPGHAHVELKPSDASANPYLALAGVLAAGLSGLEERLPLPEPVQEDVGSWANERRDAQGVRRLPITTDDQLAALTGSERLTAALGPELLGAFCAVRRSDAAWALDRSIDEVVAGHRWLY